MTRINCVPPSELSNQHLLAEYHELPRVYGLAYRFYRKHKQFPAHSLPPKYTMGAGHIKFFYVRLKYITARYLLLSAELRSRGFKPQYDSPPQLFMDATPSWMWLHWEPDAEALRVNRARLKERSPKAYPNLNEAGMHC